MITVYCINRKGVRFEKVFNEYWACRVFILRCQHGNNVHVEGYDTYNKDCDEELRRLLCYGY